MLSAVITASFSAAPTTPGCPAESIDVQFLPVPQTRPPFDVNELHFAGGISRLCCCCSCGGQQTQRGILTLLFLLSPAQTRRRASCSCSRYANNWCTLLLLPLLLLLMKIMTDGWLHIISGAKLVLANEERETD